jgi:molybdopterin-guanine dinucleotide biosynthesis protein A
VYRREFSNVAERALQAGQFKIDALFGGLALRVIEEVELEKAGFSERNFFNLNTPADRRAAEEST